MKTFVAVNNHTSSVHEDNSAPFVSGWFLLADSALTNTGKPFYVPFNHGKVTAKACFVVKINRLGKNIATKFAYKYYDEMAPALLFSLPEYEKLLLQQGLPADPARSFDRALFVGDFQPFHKAAEISLVKNNSNIDSLSLEDISKETDNFLYTVSEMNTMKIGDLIIPVLSDAVEVVEDDYVQIKVDGEDKFAVKIK